MIGAPIDARSRLLVAIEDAAAEIAVRSATAGIDAAIDELVAGCDVVAKAAADVYDCIVLGRELGAETGLEAVARIRSAGISTPIVWMTDHDPGAVLSLGATDLVSEAERVPRLAHRLSYALRLGRAERTATRARTELETQRRLLRAVLENLPAGVALVSHDREHILIANARAAKLLAGGRDGIPTTAEGAGPEVREALHAALERGTPVRLAEPIQHDGRSYRLSAAPVVDDTAAVLAAVLVVEDIHDVVAARDAARQSARALEDLLAVVSHDVRGPLSAINVALDALGDDAVIGPERARYVLSIQRSIKRAERLLDDLLTVHQIDFGTLRLVPSPVAVRTLLEQAVHDHELVADRAGVRLAWNVGPGIESISADRHRIAQALDNLIGNALRYAVGAPHIELSANREGDRVMMRVRDHGPGIPVDELPHVFDRDWQGKTRRGGAGLGLSIVRGIARGHGGEAIAGNADGGGAVFTIALPI